MQLEVALICRKGSDGTGAGYRLVGTFRRAAGVVTQIGATTALATHEDDAALAAALNINGTSVEVLGTGVAATNIRWTAVASLISVA